MNFLFASTALGLEELLKGELEALGAQACRIVQGGVHFQGDDRLLYQSLMWSRLASRILLPMHQCRLDSAQDLYAGGMAIDWVRLFDRDKTFAVHFTGTSHVIRDSQFGALTVKDAIVDSFTRINLARPDVDRERPDIRISVRLSDDVATIALDLSGEGLHQRGYRLQSGVAPLKENLAAAIVMRSGWQRNSRMIDPMCGSATLLIEAAMIASDRAPGLRREHWGFLSWNRHDNSLWREVIREAQVRAQRGLQESGASFYGYDINPQVLEYARANARRAGVAELIRFQVQDLLKLANTLPALPAGTVLTNPPYGERLDTEPALIALYSQLGRIMKCHFGGWKLSVFSASPALLSCMQLRADRQFKAKNGPLECIQKNYLLMTDTTAKSVQQSAEAYANRLHKNLKRREKWARQENVSCYRLYDADLPQYNVAVDRYNDQVVIQEYAAPKTVDAHKARQRFFDAIAVTLDVLKLPADKLVVKTRAKQKGKSQYQKLGNNGEFFQVSEYGARFWVNLTDYLDTGLFPDHRKARKMLGKMSEGKDFLNLFAYTGSASVHAGLGGASTTTTVDMSRTYLEWAERNLRLNGLTGRQHRLIQADCLNWLRESNEQFDVIFIDPPTFSNSKRMTDSFDVQRDHLRLMTDLKRLLRKGGTIMFSNNRRAFKFDYQGVSLLGLTAEEITAKTGSPDFTRHRHIHSSWLLTHANEE